MKRFLTLAAVMALAGLFSLAEAGEPKKRKSIFKKTTPGAVGGAMGQLLRATAVPVQVEKPKPIKGQSVKAPPKTKTKSKKK